MCILPLVLGANIQYSVLVKSMAMKPELQINKTYSLNCDIRCQGREICTKVFLGSVFEAAFILWLGDIAACISVMGIEEDVPFPAR